MYPANIYDNIITRPGEMFVYEDSSVNINGCSSPRNPVVDITFLVTLIFLISVIESRSVALEFNIETDFCTSSQLQVAHSCAHQFVDRQSCDLEVERKFYEEKLRLF